MSEAKRERLRIVCDREIPTGEDVVVELGGKDITPTVRGLTLKMKAGEVNEVTLDLLPTGVELEADADVTTLADKYRHRFGGP